MIDPPKTTKAPEIERKSVLDWSAGTVTNYDARRLVDDALASSANMVLEQNGVVRPRPSLVKYGPQIENGTYLGQIFECKVMMDAKPVFYLIAMIKVEGVANVYYAKGEDATWTKISGRDYDPDATAHFILSQGKVLVLNGVDELSYINTADWTITAFTPIGDPTTPTVEVSESLKDDKGAVVVYYAITANSSVGETAGSEVIKKTIGKDRGLWDPNTDYCEVSWSAVSGATSYNVYMGVSADGEGQPMLFLIQAGIDASVSSYKDNGQAAADITRTLPTLNTTAGPKAKRGAVINGRIWLVGDPRTPYRVWHGGNYGHELDFSPSLDGGGFVSISNGTSEVPISVMPFRKGQGDSTVVVLTQGSNGSGRRYHITSSEYTYGGSSFVSWEPTEDSGTDGTDSPDGVVVYNNSLYYPSRDGFKTTGTQPSLQNVLSTKRISNTIQDQVQLFNSASMDKAVGLAHEGCIYWAVPVGSSTNNRVFIFDIDHKGAWMCSWYISADWMLLYNDNSGATHFLMVVDNTIYELSRRLLTRDDELPFRTEIASGEISWSKDSRDWARLIQVVFTVIKPRGDINFEVTAMTEDGKQTFRNSLSASASLGGHGWSDVVAPWSSNTPWSNVRPITEETASGEEDVIIEVDEDVQWFSYKIWSSEPGVDYKVSSVVSEHVSIGIEDLS